MFYGIRLGVLFAMLLIAACDPSAPQRSSHILFVEQEKNIEPYQTRVIVTPKFMRVDDGEGAPDFVLFNRKEKLIYSVNTSARTIMIVEPQQQKVEPPIELRVEERLVGGFKDAPTVRDIAPKHYQLMVNDKVCYDFVTANGLMEDAVTAMREFQAVLASDSMLTVNAIPADVRNACSLAINTFEPNRHLSFGFPIQEWDGRGYARSLMDFDDDYHPDPALFELPEDYRRFTVQQLRTGGMPPVDEPAAGQGANPTKL
jgi:hypothetical protein